MKHRRRFLHLGFYSLISAEKRNNSGFSYEMSSGIAPHNKDVRIRVILSSTPFGFVCFTKSQLAIATIPSFSESTERCYPELCFPPISFPCLASSLPLLRFSSRAAWPCQQALGRDGRCIALKHRAEHGASEHTCVPASVPARACA